MEEKEPRKRSPKAAFSTPDQPAPPSEPAERPRRRAPKAAPPVTFQPPSATPEAPAPSESGSAEAPARRPRKNSSGTPTAPDPQPTRRQPAPRKSAKSAPAAQPTTPPRTTAKVDAPAKDVPPPVKRTPRAAKTTPPADPAPQREQAAETKPTRPRAARPTKQAPATAARPIPVQARAAETTAETTAAETTAEAPKEPAITQAVVTQAPARTPQKPEPRTEAWAKLVADPAHAPELLALAAVQTLGPRAEEWARRTRETYPHATTNGLARLAERQFLRFGSVASLFAAAAGSYVPVVLLGANAITYAELILHVAAAHHLDPTDRQRAVELLFLTQVHVSLEDAETALASAEQPAFSDDATFADAVWRLGRMASAQAGGWALIKGVNRFFPGTATLAAVMTSRSGARTMSMRTERFYSRLSQARGEIKAS